MGAFWSGTKPPQIAAKWRPVLDATSPEQYNRFMVDEMTDVQMEEVRQARAYTASRPSAKSGRAGRVDTGEMLRHITGETKLNGKGEVINRVGFLAGRKNYFKYQTTTGFVNTWTGEYIEPTFALKDAHEDAKPGLRQAGTNVLRKVQALIRKATSR